MNTEKHFRVVVCGTTFGRIYMNAISRLPDKFVLVGILARGSNNSAECAQKFNVPLYTSVDQLPFDDIDAACVVVRSSVVGGQGTKIAIELLHRGIHVIQEQPVHLDELVACMQLARKSDCCYYLNSFYHDIEPVRQFICTAQKALQNSEAIYIDAACSIIVLFPLLDILGRFLGGFRPWSFQCERDCFKKKSLVSICGYISGVPLTMRVQNQIDPDDPDNSACFLHRIELCTNSGSLILTDTHGAVLWNPRMYVPFDKNGVLDMYGTDSDLDLSITELVRPFDSIPINAIFNTLWPESIQRTLQRFWQSSVSERCDPQLNQYLLTLCKVWQDIGREIGPPEIISTEKIRPLRLDDL